MYTSREQQTCTGRDRVKIVPQMRSPSRHRIGEQDTHAPKPFLISFSECLKEATAKYVIQVKLK